MRYNPDIVLRAGAKRSGPKFFFSEKLKKRAYNAWILEIEKGTFSPLVFSCSGGASTEATMFISNSQKSREAGAIRNHSSLRSA